jgi:hypothetical protein
VPVCANSLTEKDAGSYLSVATRPQRDRFLRDDRSNCYEDWPGSHFSPFPTSKLTLSSLLSLHDDKHIVCASCATVFNKEMKPTPS